MEANNLGSTEPEKLIEDEMHLVATLAHDTNNILGVIRLCAEMQEMMRNNPEKVAMFTQQIIDTVDNASKHLLDLMIFAGKRVPPPEKMDLMASLRDCIAQYPDYPINTNVESIPSCPIEANRAMIKRILNAILENAITFRDPETPIQIDVAYLEIAPDTLQLHPKLPPPYLSIVVRNQAHIQHEIWNKILSPFVSSKAGKTKHSGMGLPLTLGYMRSIKGGFEINEHHATVNCTILFPITTEPQHE